jgi:hypothetical protein
MSSSARTLLISFIALGLAAPAFAQPKGDAGSGPTSGVASTNDAGSGPTNGAKPNTTTTAASDPNGSTDNSAGVLRAQNRPEVRNQLRQRRLRRSGKLLPSIRDGPSNPAHPWPIRGLL